MAPTGSRIASFGSVRLSQVENLLPNFFVFGKFPVFFFAQAVDRCDVDRVGGSDFWIRRYAALDAEGFLPFVRSGPAMKQPCAVRVGRVFEDRRRADQTDTEIFQIGDLRAFLNSRQ